MLYGSYSLPPACFMCLSPPEILFLTFLCPFYLISETLEGGKEKKQILVSLLFEDSYVFVIEKTFFEY